MSSYIVVGFEKESIEALKRQVLIAFLEDQRWRRWELPEWEKNFVYRTLYEIDNELDIEEKLIEDNGSRISSIFEEYADWMVNEYFDFPERRGKMDEKLMLVCNRMKCDLSLVKGTWDKIHKRLDEFLKSYESKEEFGLMHFRQSMDIKQLYEQFGEQFESGVSLRYVMLVENTTDYDPYTIIENAKHPDYEKNRSERGMWM